MKNKLELFEIHAAQGVVMIVCSNSYPMSLKLKNKAHNLMVELLTMSKNNTDNSINRCVFLGESKQRVIEIGEWFYKNGGHQLMVEVSEVIDLIANRDLRELDFAFDGIGQWKC